MLAMPLGLIRFNALNDCDAIKLDFVENIDQLLMKMQFKANIFAENAKIDQN